MEQFTGLEYIKIDVANNFGHDKLTWEQRIDWFDRHEKQLKYMLLDADSKFLAMKGLQAYMDAKRGKPTGFIMGLDATASGLQIMACLSGCKKTASAVNLVNTGKREDVYSHVAHEMNLKLDPSEHVTRAIIKKPLMTHYYNKSTPEGLSENQTVVFFEALGNNFSGAEDIKKIITSLWNPTALRHSWKLPDYHLAKVNVTDTNTKRIEIDELDHHQVTYQFQDIMPSKRSTSLCPNVVHSYDGWVAREMVKRAYFQGFQLVHIHDSFWASPNYMNQVRQNYVDILAELAEMDAMNNLIKDITGKNVVMEKDSYDLADEIRRSEYALS